MSAVSATSAAPVWATTVWCDANSLFVEYRNADGASPPFVVKYDRTATGLQEALKGMIIEFDKRAPKPVYVPQVPVSIPAKGVKGKRESRLTDEQRKTTLDVLKKLGLL